MNDTIPVHYGLPSFTCYEVSNKICLKKEMAAGHILSPTSSFWFHPDLINVGFQLKCSMACSLSPDASSRCRVSSLLRLNIKVSRASQRQMQSAHHSPADPGSGKQCVDVLMEGWLLVSCSSSSSSIQEVMKELSAAGEEGRLWLEEDERSS